MINGDRFDAFVRLLGTGHSRRRLLHTLTGGVFAGLGALRGRQAVAQGLCRPAALPFCVSPLGRRAIVGIGVCSLLFLLVGFVLTRDRQVDGSFLAGLVCTIWGVAGLITAVRFALTTRT